MTKKDSTERFFSIVVREGLSSSQDNLKFHLKNLFKEVSFDNKRMLDIGCGKGIHSFYAACMGAKEVVCLEPEVAGSSGGMIECFNELQSYLGLEQVRLETVTVQSFHPGSEKFDIILLHNSINHLDEQACINLQYDENAREIYRAIFQKLGNLSNTGAKLIVCDCSRYNFFAPLNIKNPFASTIEWHKHQAPEYWAKLLSEFDFHNPEISWTSFNTLRSLGKVLLGNKFMSYFLSSHFCLRMQKANCGENEQLAKWA